MYKIKEKINIKIWVWRLLFYFSCFVVLSCLLFFIYNIIVKYSVNKEVEASYIEQKYTMQDGEKYKNKPIYHYIVDGKEYECKSTFELKPEDIKSGTVHYNNNNPEICMTDYSYSHYSKIYLYLIPIPIFVFFLIYSLINIQRKKKQKKKIDNLLKDAILVKGIPYTTEIHQGTNETMDLMVIVSEYKFPDGKTRILKSEEFYYFNTKKKSIDLLYDPNNYDNYYIGVNIERIK